MIDCCPKKRLAISGTLERRCGGWIASWVEAGLGPNYHNRIMLQLQLHDRYYLAEIESLSIRLFGNRKDQMECPSHPKRSTGEWHLADRRHRRWSRNAIDSHQTYCAVGEEIVFVSKFEFHTVCPSVHTITTNQNWHHRNHSQELQPTHPSSRSSNTRHLYQERSTITQHIEIESWG